MTLDPVIESLVLKTKTRQEIANEYSICVKTLNSRMEEAGLNIPRGLIFPKTIKEIYYTLGIPAGIKASL